MSVSANWMSASRSFAELVERVPAGRWNEPALGPWTLRDLVGHTASAGVRSVLAAAERPALREDITTAAGYYALVQSVDPAIYAAGVAASTEDAHRTGKDLGSHPARAVADMIDLAAAKVDPLDHDTVVGTAAGGMRLGEWLPTRTFELAVHCLDIAGAAGIEDHVPEEVLAEAAALAARTAAAIGQGRALLLAVTGRGHLPHDFSVVQPSVTAGQAD